MTRLKAGGPAIAKQGILVAFILFMIAFSLMSDRFLSADRKRSDISEKAIMNTMKATRIPCLAIAGPPALRRVISIWLLPDNHRPRSPGRG